MTNIHLDLIAGLDRPLAWYRGESVRYLVADLSARAEATPGEAARRAAPPLNLALCIDISGSMAGDKIVAARDAALAVAATMTARDRLSIVAFDSIVEVLLDGRAMDAEGRALAATAIHRLQPRGGTNLFAGWVEAAQRVAATATTMGTTTGAGGTPRVLILSDGQANEGTTDPTEIAVHVGALLDRGVLTSALGIGEGYDERLLGAIAAAGGGNLHDAAGGGEVSEVVLGELREGREALLERVVLKLAVPAGLRAEVVGSWASTPGADGLEVTVGSLRPEQTRRLVVRLHCPAGEVGQAFDLAVAASGQRPDGSGAVAARPVTATLTLAEGTRNNAQVRDLGRTLAVVNAWQSEVVRAAVLMNRDGDYRAARSFVERELRFLERYARNVPGAEPMLRDLAIVQRSIHEEWSERDRKEVYLQSVKASRLEIDMSPRFKPSLQQRFAPRR